MEGAGVLGREWGKGEEMTQTLCAHMNKKRKKKEDLSDSSLWLKLIVFRLCQLHIGKTPWENILTDLHCL
jgi:hypothetical protein